MNNPKQKKLTVKSDKAVAMEVSTVTIAVNFVLSLLKLLAGIFSRSGAMISDAVHSASDVFSTFVVMIGVSLSERKLDHDHPYGHERLECVASIVLAAILAATGLGIGLKGIQNVLGGDYSHLQVPGISALIAAVISIIVKEWMYHYTRAAAKKINSGALLADAWHHRSDSLSSIGAFAGILGARLGFPVLDSVACIIICLFIEKAALDIFKDATDKMVDKACPDSVVEDMEKVISSIEGVERIDDVRTRLFGAKIYVDVEFSANGSITLTNAHQIAETVHNAIESNFPNVKHCMVHVNPMDKQNEN